MLLHTPNFDYIVHYYIYGTYFLSVLQTRIFVSEYLPYRVYACLVRLDCLCIALLAVDQQSDTPGAIINCEIYFRGSMQMFKSSFL